MLPRHRSIQRSKLYDTMIASILMFLFSLLEPYFLPQSGLQVFQLLSRADSRNAGVESGLFPKGFFVGNERLLADRKSTRLNSSHANISYAVFCLKKKNIMASFS